MYATAKEKNAVSKAQFHSRISFESGTVSRIRFIEGVRAFMALIVIFHHVDLINPRINRVSNIIWTIHKNKPNVHLNLPHDFNPDSAQRIKVFTDDYNEKIDHTETITDHKRQLLSNKGHPIHGSLTTFGMFASVFDITLFCGISGYVISLLAFKCYNYDFQFEGNHDQNVILCSANYPFWLYKFVRLIIRRSLKMCHSLFWVQLSAFILFHFGFMKLRGSEVWAAREYYDEFWTKNCHFSALFWSEINGALWVCDMFFWSTSAAFIVLCITINLTDIKYRIFIYLIFCILFNNDYYLPILMGIIAADIDYHQYYEILFTKHKIIHNLIAASVLLLFVKIPIIDFFPGYHLTCKCIGWFNLGLYCCQYPKFWLTRFFAHDYLCYWGQYTFSLYIWHMIIYRVIGTLITPLFIDKREVINHLVWFDYAIIIFGVFCACIFAIMFNKLFEKPWNKYVVKRVLDKFQSLQNENDKKA